MLCGGYGVCLMWDVVDDCSIVFVVVVFVVKDGRMLGVVSVVKLVVSV